MADPRFYQRAGPFTANQLAELVGGTYRGDDIELVDLTNLDDAKPDTLGFLSNAKLVDSLTSSQAGAVLVPEALADACSTHTQPIVCADAYKAMALASQAFYPAAARSLPMPGDMQDGHHIHPTANLGTEVQIGAGALIGPNVDIGDGTVIAAGAIIGHGVKIGRRCTIGANAVIGYALIGDEVIIAANTTIGSDGFGFAPGASHIKIPQLGRVIIQTQVEIGANCAIDRGSLSDTVIGEGSKIDNQVHLAHNVVMGRHCFITAQCAVAGSARLGDYVQMGGQSAVSGHVTVGNHCLIAANASVLRSIGDNQEVSGVPARPRAEVYRDAAFVSRLRKKGDPSGS